MCQGASDTSSSSNASSLSSSGSSSSSSATTISSSRTSQGEPDAAPTDGTDATTSDATADGSRDATGDAAGGDDGSLTDTGDASPGLDAFPDAPGGGPDSARCTFTGYPTECNDAGMPIYVATATLHVESWTSYASCPHGDGGPDWSCVGNWSFTINWPEILTEPAEGGHLMYPNAASASYTDPLYCRRYGPPPAMMNVTCAVTYADGTTANIVFSGSWSTSPGH